MSTIYAESSAVLRWLLGASNADRTEHTLATADVVVTSQLTAAEVGRSLQRLVATGGLDAKAGEQAWASYATASRHWRVYGVGEPVLHRVRQAFPREPVRTLDAVHLATAILYALEVGPAVILSVAEQVRVNAGALGFAVAPAPS